MAAAAIFKKSKNRHISASVSAITQKFGTVMDFDPLHPFHPSNFYILKILDGHGRHLEKSTNRHISATV